MACCCEEGVIVRYGKKTPDGYRLRAGWSSDPLKKVIVS
jgi:hypothetical protein